MGTFFGLFIGVFVVALGPAMMVTALWENCDYYEDLVLGRQYTFSSPGYPNFYGSQPFSCRWTARAPAGYIVALSCYKELPVVSRGFMISKFFFLTLTTRLYLITEQ